MIKLAPSPDRVATMVAITGDPVDEIIDSLTLDVGWALANLSLGEWWHAVESAAYERKANPIGLLRWPLREVLYDVCFHALH